MALPLDVAVLALVALALAAALAVFLQRPRLVLELSLRGGAKHGTLYVTLANVGRTSARELRIDVAWIANDGRRVRIEETTLDDLAPADATRLEVTRLRAAIAGEPEGWSAIEVRVRAKNARRASAQLALTQREVAGDEPEPVRYVRGVDLPCPESPDGKHRFEVHRVPNDGVVETWRACGRCRHLARDPLPAADEAKQAALRQERAERLRRDMETEFARHAARESDPRRERAPWRDEDTFPPSMAFFVLELDATSAQWEDVLAAHRRLALANHPDRRPDVDAATRAALERRMQEINSARDRLKEHFGVKSAVDP